MGDALNNISSVKLTAIIDDLDKTSNIASTIANEISEKCTSSLDAYVHFISEQLRTTNAVTNDMLDDFILNLPIYIYYASSAIETLGIKEDISSISKKKKITDVLTKMKDHSVGGTAAFRTSLAESTCSEDIVINSIYSAAYKIAKSKIDFAYEVLASCKKVMSRRIEELKAFNSDTKRNVGSDKIN